MKDGDQCPSPRGPVQATAERKEIKYEEILESAVRQSHQYITPFDTLRYDVFLGFSRARRE